MAENQTPAARWTWVVLALVAACVEPIAVKLGYRASATPYQTLLVRNSVAAVVILPLLAASRGLRSNASLEGRPTQRASWPEMARLAGLGALLFCTAQLTLLAFARLTVAVVLSIISLTPFVVALTSRRRALGPRFLGGAACGVVGAALATGLADVGSHEADLIGVACAVGAVATSTIYRLGLERVTVRHTPSVVSTWVFATSGIMALILVAPFAGLPPSAAWWAGGWTGVSAAIANVGFVSVVQVLGAARASLLMLLQRPLVIGIAAVTLGERPGPIEATGVALVLFGVWLGRPQKAKKE